jgi:hypothetical protein
VTKGKPCPHKKDIIDSSQPLSETEWKNERIAATAERIIDIIRERIHDSELMKKYETKKLSIFWRAF